MIHTSTSCKTTCPFCNSSKMQPYEKKFKTKWKQTEIKYSIFGGWCTNCNNGIVMNNLSQRQYHKIFGILS